ncbi:hypothetical protein EDB19DRAFT_296154 [Suillus lakei]|nr:hypothetical protein EDB19DRAFT_296154 [Suillus lakei]
MYLVSKGRSRTLPITAICYQGIIVMVDLGVTIVLIWAMHQRPFVFGFDPTPTLVEHPIKASRVVPSATLSDCTDAKAKTSLTATLEACKEVLPCRAATVPFLVLLWFWRPCTSRLYFSLLHGISREPRLAGLPTVHRASQNRREHWSNPLHFRGLDYC